MFPVHWDLILKGILILKPQKADSTQLEFKTISKREKSDSWSRNSIDINGLLTGCEGHTEKYRTAVFVQPELARAVLKDHGPVFLSMARANPVNKPFII